MLSDPHRLVDIFHLNCQASCEPFSKHETEFQKQSLIYIHLIKVVFIYLFEMEKMTIW